MSRLSQNLSGDPKAFSRFSAASYSQMELFGYVASLKRTYGANSQLFKVSHETQPDIQYNLLHVYRRLQDEAECEHMSCQLAEPSSVI